VIVRRSLLLVLLLGLTACSGGGSTDEAATKVDVPDAPSGTFVHWVLLDIRPHTAMIAQGTVPDGAVQARNGAGDASYTGPCPPSGTHHYRFTVYALRADTGLAAGASTAAALRAVRKTATARGRLVGTYSRG
jgi:Raf kinase inhibitor-like YbhB/YbcL family protein